MKSLTATHTGVPTFFRACCYEASHGGTNSYRNAGWHLAIHLYDQQPYDVEMDDWEECVEELKASCADEDQDEIWQWFNRHYPKCMEFVPNSTVRRRCNRCLQ